MNMPDLGIVLLQLARSAIADRFGTTPRGDFDSPDLPELGEPGATFVTLMHDCKLRGCIGTLVPHRPLVDDVRSNARNAAFHDPRFPPLIEQEWARTSVEVSLLTPPQPLRFKDEVEALAQLRPGIDGIVFAAGHRSATFLPQVWEQLPEPSEFLAHLKRKAGLRADYWGLDVRLERYEVMKWKEEQIF